MKRRTLLKAAATLAVTPFAQLRGDERNDTKPRIMTVLGECKEPPFGTMLPHEHVLVDFIGADKVSPDRYNRDEVFEVMLPYLAQARAAGCQILAECTPDYLGRDPLLLRRLSEASGVKLLTNTGYYGARQGKYLPKHAFQESPDELASRWTHEWDKGIAHSGIRPGFIKIGMDAGPLSEMNRKLVQAAARCHLTTGLTIASHTGDGEAARQQIDILKQSGVSPAAWIWVHAQNEKNLDIHRQAASMGAWIEFDGVGPASMEQHVKLVSNMQRAKLLDQVLISQDAGWYSAGEPRGGSVRSYETIFRDFLPALRNAGLTEDEIQQLTVINPIRAFSVQQRPASTS